MKNLNCDHPKVCMGLLPNDDDSTKATMICKWCEEVRILKSVNTTLRAQLHDQAVIIEGGEVTLKCTEIGLLEVLGGNVSFPNINSNPVIPLKT